MMYRAAFLVALCAAAASAQAQSGRQGDAATALEQLAEAIRDAARALSDSATPWAEGLGAVLADPGAYEPPETLPNGDILIRRKPDAPPPGRDRAPPALDPDAPVLDL